MSSPEMSRLDYITRSVERPVPEGAKQLAAILQQRYAGCSVILYGSGISLLKDANHEDVLYDFYVIVPSYKDAYRSRLLRFLNFVLPPNVFYIETNTPEGEFRAKYAVLSLKHFEKLVSRQTFHSYFWARFAQPARIVVAPEAMKKSLITMMETAVDTFTSRSISYLSDQNSTQKSNFRSMWKAGLSRSYRAELRAEQPERVEKLLDSYGDWPERVTNIPQHVPSKTLSEFAWRFRAIQGGLLSALRLLKGILTFDNGVDYLAWKIGRHAGFTFPVKDWERQWPLLAAPFLVRRYYRLRKNIRTRPVSE